MILSNQIKQKAQGIELVIFDVDGVLTDGTLVYGPNGEEVKHFNVKDGVGIKLLQEYNVAVAIISAKSSKPLAKRIADLGIKHVYTGCKDKVAALNELAGKLKLEHEQIAYCGDDVIDLKVMLRVGLALAPSDAYELVRSKAHLVLEAAGGKGVAREVCDLIISSKMDLEEAYIKAMLPEFEDIKKL
jgi:3-deoxy-D-manno-octulosonate 8-phosphate phosphatase (KDO 8-P phosphatase)